ncbi:MAG: hypothetical protein D4S01_04475 [Dehalococcoidia bacterium]|nr:MAG: hypothetical protein D4S01_04475 [Dehalococcoidia bacterium]
MKKIKKITNKIYILAYKEDVRQLENWFQQQGFSVSVCRRNYTQQELSFSTTIRALTNHRDAWSAIVASGEAGIVVESDFVPITEFGDAYAPFDPDISPIAVGWLYGGANLYRFDKGGYAIGHCSTAVALLITELAAPKLVKFADEEIKKSRGKYSIWDSYMSHGLRREMDVPTYIPFKQFGEHGGLSSNPEHKKHKIREWHQADILLGPLAFMPAYARGSVLRYRLLRLRANIRGLLRVFLGKYIAPCVFKSSDKKNMMIKFLFYKWFSRRKAFITTP